MAEKTLIDLLNERIRKGEDPNLTQEIQDRYQTPLRQYLDEQKKALMRLDLKAARKMALQIFSIQEECQDFFTGTIEILNRSKAIYKIKALQEAFQKDPENARLYGMSIALETQGETGRHTETIELYQSELAKLENQMAQNKEIIKLYGEILGEN